MKKFLDNPHWRKAIVINVTDTGRFKVTAPGGFYGFGRSSEDAVRDCAKNIPETYTFKE